mgnify:CR=1 FL=1
MELRIGACVRLRLSGCSADPLGVGSGTDIGCILFTALLQSWSTLGREWNVRDAPYHREARPRLQLQTIQVNFASNGFSLRPSHYPVGSGVQFLETTGLIRQVAFQSIVCMEDGPPRDPIHPNSPIGYVVKRIWPGPNSRRWPPSGSLSRAGYDSLKGLFERTAVAHSHLSGERPHHKL